MPLSCGEAVRSGRGRLGADPGAVGRLASGGVLDERERRRGHRCERDEGPTPPGLDATHTRARAPGSQQLVRRPEALERNARRLARIATRPDVVGDRVFEVIPELGGEPACSRPANVCGNRSEILVHVGH
jgi:hypothetical protein